MTPVPIRPATGTRDVDLVRALFGEYAAWLGVDLGFQGFAEELATLPGKYAPPRGRLLIAGPPGRASGCVALRPLDPAPAPFASAEPVGEVKRLYVLPEARGTGTGRALACAIIDAARAIGYRTLCHDTLERMPEARSLYESLGFAHAPPYYDNPLADAAYYSLALR